MSPVLLAAPGWLWAALPLLVGWWVLRRLQRRALAAVETGVGPRFRPLLTCHSRRSLAVHLGLLLAVALLLVLAAARPYLPGAEERTAGGRVLFLIDASGSMYAGDVAPLGTDAAPAPEEESAPPAKRMDVARFVAREMVRRLEDHRFALVSYSGQATLHLPMTGDRAQVEDALAVLEEHGHYQQSGSSLAAALGRAFHFVDPDRRDLSIVLIGDGEVPHPDAFEEPLAALAAQGVPVHAVGVGSLAGEARKILDFRDVAAGVESPRALREYHTRRVDEHFRVIAGATGGELVLATAAGVEEIVTAIRGHEGRVRPALDGQYRVITEGGEGGETAATAAGAGYPAARGGRDVTAWPLALAFLGFLVETLGIGRVGMRRRRQAAETGFDLDALGPGGEDAGWGAGLERPDGVRAAASGAASAPGSASTAALLALGIAVLPVLALLPVAAGCTGAETATPRELAHRDNERGIALDRLGRHETARRMYERSRGYGERPDVPVELPAYNLARSHVLSRAYAEAHEAFEEVLLMAPDLAEAHYNDGLALYCWGAAERDPRDCDLARTRDLWQAASARLGAALARADASSRLADLARANGHAVARELATVERLIADPPAHCRSEAPQGGGGGEGDGEGDEGEGRGEKGKDEAKNPGGGGGGSESSPDGEDGAPPGGPGGRGDEAGQGDEQENQVGGGGQQDARRDGGGGAPRPLTLQELETIAQALERIAAQRGEEGKYHRRTLPEQFPRAAWENPDPVVWW